MLLDKTAFVSRLQKNSTDNDKEAYVTHSGFRGPGQIPTSAIKINIQPASAELTVLTEGVVGKTFKAFTTVSGVVEGMRLTVSGTGQQFKVTGREVFDYGVNTHYELVLVKADR